MTSTRHLDELVQRGEVANPGSRGARIRAAFLAEHQLWLLFQSFGGIIYVKILIGQGCGFVQFVHRSAAKIVMSQMQGHLIGDSRVRLSWGKSKNNPRTPYHPAPRPPHTKSYSHDDIWQVVKGGGASSSKYRPPPMASGPYSYF